MKHTQKDERKAQQVEAVLCDHPPSMWVPYADTNAAGWLIGCDCTAVVGWVSAAWEFYAIEQISPDAGWLPQELPSEGWILTVFHKVLAIDKHTGEHTTECGDVGGPHHPKAPVTCTDCLDAYPHHTRENPPL